jgi:hypothetical protein
MRIIIVIACALVAASACTLETGRVAYHPWCLHNSISGAVACSYDTLAQCTQLTQGEGICTANREPRPPDPPPADDAAAPAPQTAPN